MAERGLWTSTCGTNLSNTTSSWNGGFPRRCRASASQSIINTLIRSICKVTDMAITGCVSVVVTTPDGIVTPAVTLENQQPSFGLLKGRYAAGENSRRQQFGACGAGSTSCDLDGASGLVQFQYAARVKMGETLVLSGVRFGLAGLYQSNVVVAWVPSGYSQHPGSQSDYFFGGPHTGQCLRCGAMMAILPHSCDKTKRSGRAAAVFNIKITLLCRKCIASRVQTRYSLYFEGSKHTFWG